MDPAAGPVTFIAVGPRASGNHAIRAVLEHAGLKKQPGMPSLENRRLMWAEGHGRKNHRDGWHDFNAMPSPKLGGFVQGHVPPGPWLPWPTLLILREPREVVLSWYLRKAGKPSPETFRRWLSENTRVFPEVRGYYEMAGHADLVLRFESLPESMEALSDFAGVRCDASVLRMPPARWGDRADSEMDRIFERRWHDADWRGLLPQDI